MPETLLFFDVPAAAAIEAATAFFAAAGLTITQRSPFSVSFAGPPPPDPTGPDGRPLGWASLPAAAAEADGAALLQANSGQVAAVPIQLRPAWCRAWVTVVGNGAAASAAASYVDRHQERSRALAGEIAAVEREIYHEDRWPAYEAQVRASLAQRGAGAEEVQARVAALRKRWHALGRKAARSAEPT